MLDLKLSPVTSQWLTERNTSPFTLLAPVSCVWREELKQNILQISIILILCYEVENHLATPWLNLSHTQTHTNLWGVIIQGKKQKYGLGEGNEIWQVNVLRDFSEKVVNQRTERECKQWITVLTAWNTDLWGEKSNISSTAVHLSSWVSNHISARKYSK